MKIHIYRLLGCSFKFSQDDSQLIGTSYYTGVSNSLNFI